MGSVSLGCVSVWVSMGSVIVVQYLVCQCVVQYGVGQYRVCQCVGQYGVGQYWGCQCVGQYGVGQYRGCQCVGQYGVGQYRVCQCVGQYGVSRARMLVHCPVCAVEAVEPWQGDSAVAEDVAVRPLVHPLDQVLLVEQGVVGPQRAGRVVEALVIVAQLRLTARRQELVHMHHLTQ
ncbi:hypothetical protein ANANG_G00166710 [Anguilla anguilla]|uniref:Uncharacterized protein n=1 Tax=Anguilla anguilla TaxID=7936 RepID=A0A9D3RVP6_ANGAN|nr:hypothetical protein ANANG_G00166710 [Anguilla anguilla]